MNFDEYCEWSKTDPRGASMWAGQNKPAMLLLQLQSMFGDTEALELFAKVKKQDNGYIEFARAVNNSASGEGESEVVDVKAVRERILAW